MEKKKVKGRAKNMMPFSPLTLSSSRSPGYWAQASTWWVKIYMKRYCGNAGIIALYLVISILMQFLAGRKVPLTGVSDNLNVKVLDLKSTIKFKMKKVVILFSSEGC